MYMSTIIHEAKL